MAYRKRYRIAERVKFTTVHGYGWYDKTSVLAEAKRVHAQAGNRVEVHIVRADGRWDCIWSSDRPTLVGR